VADRAGHQLPLFRQRDHPRQDIEADQAPLLQFLGSKFAMFGGATSPRRDPHDRCWCFFSAYVLKQTAWGRHVYAVGDDPEAAELSGVNVKRTLISVYMLRASSARLPAGP
jgi:fructose transport system permease protein